MAKESFKQQPISHVSIFSNPSEETIFKIYKICQWTKMLLYKLNYSKV